MAARKGNENSLLLRITRVAQADGKAFEDFEKSLHPVKSRQQPTAAMAAAPASTSALPEGIIMG